MKPQTIGIRERETLQSRIASLGPWFHNLRIADIETAPAHPLGNYPSDKWSRFSHAVPADLSGQSVLDIGCNGGFYSLEMKRRGASRVVAIDSDERYLEQARLAANVSGADIEFRRLSVYDVGALGERFDLVLFMGVLYHLRYPLLALDRIREHVAADLLLFQSLLRGSGDEVPVAADYPFCEEAVFQRPGFPVLHFVEHAYAEDPTNWWIPNRACAAAMLRSSGFDIVTGPFDDVFLCRVAPSREGSRHG